MNCHVCKQPIRFNKEMCDLVVKYYEAIKNISDGKPMEILSGGSWEHLSADPTFSSPPEDYRVKPEVEYTPFSNKDVLVGTTLLSADKREKLMIVAQDDFGIVAGVDHISYEDAVESFVFISTLEPFGEKKE